MNESGKRKWKIKSDSDKLWAHDEKEKIRATILHIWNSKAFMLNAHTIAAASVGSSEKEEKRIQSNEFLAKNMIEFERKRSGKPNLAEQVNEMASVPGNVDERKSLHRSTNRIYYYKFKRDWKKGRKRNISLVSMSPCLACFSTTIDCRIVVTSLSWLQISRFNWQECQRKYSKQKKKTE